MDYISYILAFSGGLLSFLSPCVLPLIPAYLSFLTGSAVNEIDESNANLKLMKKAFGFVIGFSLIFIIMGISVSSVAKLFTTNQMILRQIGGIIIIIFGIHTTGLIKIKALYSEIRFMSFINKKTPYGSVLLGMAFATGWTPCIGPILSSILIYAGSMDTILKGVTLLILYSIGLAIPFLLSAYAIWSFSTYFKKFSKYLPIISIASGILMIIMGVLVLSDKLTLLNRYTNF